MQFVNMFLYLFRGKITALLAVAIFIHFEGMKQIYHILYMLLTAGNNTALTTQLLKTSKIQ